MKRYYMIQLLVIFLLSTAFSSFSQNTLQARLAAIPGVKVTLVTNSYYKEYYEIMVPQFQDHSNNTKPFTQRLYLGINNIKFPIVMETDGYSIDQASRSEYTNEIASNLNANLLVVELCFKKFNLFIDKRNSFIFFIRKVV